MSQSLTQTPVPSRLSPLNRFFFGEEIPYGVALMRMGLTFTLMLNCWHRWPFVRELYTADGSPTPLADLFGYPDFLPILPASVAIPLYAAMMMFLVFAGVGWMTRFSLTCTTVLFPYFCMLDMHGTQNKYTVICTHGLLLLTLSPCGKVWSLDAWLKGRSRRRISPLFADVDQLRSPVWVQKLIILFVAIVYFGAALTKIHTPTYFTGDQMIFWMLTNYNYYKPVGEYLTDYPLVSIVGAYICFIWEVLFPFCCWKGWGRRSMIGLGVLFHLGTYVMLGLTLFPLVMFSFYMAFLTEEDVHWIAVRWRNFLRACALPRWRSVVSEIPSPLAGLPMKTQRMASVAAFCLVLFAGVGSGVLWERQHDLYGMNRPEGPYPLRELSENEVQNFFGPERPFREEDKFFGFNVGTTYLAGRLFDRRTEFKQGETALCEVSLTPPHEDLFLECTLRDDQDNLIHKASSVCARDRLHFFFYFKLDQTLAPGDYRVVLHSKGREMLHRSFKLIGTPSSSTPAVPLAN